LTRGRAVRLVLDTNVVASAMLWGGTPRHLLEAGRGPDVSLFTSLPMLRELGDVLDRRKFARKVAASGWSVDQLVGGYAQLASVVRPIETGRIAPDPDDDVVIGTALASLADAIVTGDKALLSVGSHRQVRILGVAQALEAIASHG
jgi:putative PIN family toxin of toxin-antitoxin system